MNGTMQTQTCGEPCVGHWGHYGEHGAQWTGAACNGAYQTRIYHVDKYEVFVNPTQMRRRHVLSPRNEQAGLSASVSNRFQTDTGCTVHATVFEFVFKKTVRKWSSIGREVVGSCFKSVLLFPQVRGWRWHVLPPRGSGEAGCALRHDHDDNDHHQLLRAVDRMVCGRRPGSRGVA